MASDDFSTVLRHKLALPDEMDALVFADENRMLFVAPFLYQLGTKNGETELFVTDVRALKVDSKSSSLTRVRLVSGSKQRTQKKLPEHCFALCVSTNSSRLAIVAKHSVIVCTPGAPSASWPCITVQRHHDSADIVQAAFHPQSSTHILVLYSDLTLIIFDISFPARHPRHMDQVIDLSNIPPNTFYVGFALEPPPSYHPRENDNSSAEEEEEEETDAFLWGAFTLHLLLDNGGICALCPIIPSGVSVDASLVLRLMDLRGTSDDDSAWLERVFEVPPEGNNASSSDRFISRPLNALKQPRLQGPCFQEDEDDVDDALYTALSVLHPSGPPLKLLRMCVKSGGVEGGEDIACVDVFIGLKALLPSWELEEDLDEDLNGDGGDVDIDEKSRGGQDTFFSDDYDDDDVDVSQHTPLPLSGHQLEAALTLAERLSLVATSGPSISTTGKRHVSDQCRLLADPLDPRCVLAQTPFGLFLITLHWLPELTQSFFPQTIPTLTRQPSSSFILDSIKSDVQSFSLRLPDRRTHSNCARGVALLSDPLLGRYVVGLDETFRCALAHVPRFMSPTLMKTTTTQDQKKKNESTNKEYFEPLLKRLATTLADIRTSRAKFRQKPLHLNNADDFAIFTSGAVEQFRGIKRELLRSHKEVQYVAHELEVETKEQRARLVHLTSEVDDARTYNTALREMINLNQQFNIALKNDLKKAFALQRRLAPSSIAAQEFTEFVRECDTKRVERLRMQTSVLAEKAIVIEQERASLHAAAMEEGHEHHQGLNDNQLEEIYMKMVQCTDSLATMKKRVNILQKANPVLR